MQRSLNVGEELARLPAQPIAAVQVLRLVADPDASAAQLGALIDTDPSLSARVLRLANAPHYGLAGTVSSASRAVVLLGFATVKGVAAAAANGLVAEHANFGPPDYWAHSIAAAAAAAVVARHVGMTPADAFTAGLLHDLGTALMYRADASLYEQVSAAGGAGLAEAELEAFGMTHAQAGAAALQAWKLPARLVHAVEDHHGAPDRRTDALTKVVVAGEALATTVEDLELAESSWPLGAAFDAIGVEARYHRKLIAEATQEFENTARLLQAAR